MSESSDRYHEGERAVQRAAGEQEAASQNAVIIADAVMSAARTFLRAQRMLVVASRDSDGSFWASIIFGEAGFVSVDDDGQSATVNRAMTTLNDTDILWANLKIGAPLGLLAIDLSTRRRFRINGHVEVLTQDQLVLRVEQAYPNCPKYIQRRRLRAATPRAVTGTPTVTEGKVPDAALLAAVEKADTLFVASGHPSRGLDASHRGGSSGFIQILAPDLFRIPDYSGNGMFNTLGNLSVNARCGLTFLDFQNGRIYQMTGEATVHLDSSASDSDAAQTGRYWDFLARAWRSTELQFGADWEFVDFSPYNPPP